MNDSPVVVVGAGLAGLACATTLHAAGVPVRVVEAGDAVGGRVRTDLIDGYRCDRGFQVMLTAYPEAHRQLDLGALDLRRFDPGAVVQLGADRSVIADPFRAPQRAFASLRSPVGSVADKLRVAWLRRRVRQPHPADLLRGDDMSTRDALVEAGFSEQMIDRFFRPLFGGIQLDPSLSTSRRMFDVIFRMLADGDSAVPATGMQAIPDQLAATLPAGSIEFGAPVTSVSASGVITGHGSIDASAVVVACDGPAAAALLDLPAVASNAAGAVWFAADAPPSDDRLVFLDGLGGPVLNAAIMTNVAPAYAPPGRHLVVAAMPGVVEGDLAGIARGALRTWWGSQVDGWDVVNVNRIAHGQPRRGVPLHPKLPVRLSDGLYVCGDHRDTGSIQGALYSGRRCAEAILATAIAASPPA
jgi:phytoene dehydrogenase-like protein